MDTERARWLLAGQVAALRHTLDVQELAVRTQERRGDDERAARARLQAERTRELLDEAEGRLHGLQAD